MEYTVQKLGKIAGISTRTLRYYDEIGILKPTRINSSGYRLYGRKEVDRLQQILFFRELGVNLSDIGKILDSPCFDGLSTLREHRQKLLDRRNQLDLLIVNVEKTIKEKEGRLNMTDREKFEGFKKNLIDENERKYGAEVREKYGDKTVDESNRKMMNMTKEQYEEFTRLGEQVIEALREAVKTGDPASEPARKLADLHRQWLSFTWTQYSKEAHIGLAQMYVADERFKAYYDEKQPGGAEFLRDAILIYASEKE